MEISSILTADVLDIIFEGRNKEYGAYELRRSYRKRLIISITVMLTFIMLLLTGYILAGKTGKVQQAKEFIIPETRLTQIEPEQPEVKLPPPPKQTPPPQQQMRQYTNFQLVHEEVKPDERPPEMTELEDAKIDIRNQDGLKDDGIVAPPVDDAGKGVVEAPKRAEEDENTIFTKVEIESMYPGGGPAWIRFLKRNLNYPQAAMDNEIQGTVIVQFVVDKEGVVSDVHAISGPQELRAEAERVIRKSGKWTAAIQNGNKVKSYKNQPISFQFNPEE